MKRPIALILVVLLVLSLTNLALAGSGASMWKRRRGRLRALWRQWEEKRFKEK